MTTHSSTHHIELFYDGDCPLCAREVGLIRRLDRRGRIRFTDIAAPDFNAMAEVGVPWSTLMDRIHARLGDGTLIEGVEVFRELYAAIGLSRLIGWTRWPGISQALDAAYRLFARHRLRFTGRCSQDGCRVPVER